MQVFGDAACTLPPQAEQDTYYVRFNVDAETAGLTITWPSDARDSEGTSVRDGFVEVWFSLYADLPARLSVGLVLQLVNDGFEFRGCFTKFYRDGTADTPIT